MATERDVYQLNVDQAVGALNELTKHLDGSKDESKALGIEIETTEKKVAGFADLLKNDLKNSYLTAQAQYDLLKSAIVGVGHFLADSVQDYAKSEQASLRLSVALRNAGDGALKFKDSLDNQATAIERLTGVEDEYVSSIQTLLVSFGVAPELLERTTKAAFDLAAVTGSAETAARLLAKADAEGKDELKKFNIELDDGVPKGERFAAMLGQVEERFGGLSEQMPESVKRINELKGAWSSLKESLGGLVSELVAIEPPTSRLIGWLSDGQHKALSLTQTIDVWTNLLKGNTTQTEAHTQAIKLQTLSIQDLKKNADAAIAAKGVVFGDEESEAIKPRSEAEKAAEASRRQAAREARERKAIQEANDAFNARMNASKIGNQDENEPDPLEQAGFSNVSTIQLRLASEKLAVQESAAQAQAYHDNWQRSFEAEEAQRTERLERDRMFWAGMRQNFEGYGQTLVSAWANYFGQMLTSNTRFTREMRELAFERETVGLSEEAANAKRASMEKQLAEERGAAFLKVTADALASIAQQSATKAIFEGAEAVAALARADIPSATQHGIAAGLYAGVAVAAGGGAAAISAARGTTTEERQQLEGAAKREKERTEREARQNSQTSKEAGTQVNIYNLGISGKTERDQGRELSRVLNQYSDLRTGGG